MNMVQNSILETLAYYQIFRHPLNAGELLERASVKGLDQENLKTALAELTSQGVVLEDNGFYFLEGDDQIISRRKEG